MDEPEAEVIVEARSVKLLKEKLSKRETSNMFTVVYTFHKYDYRTIYNNSISTTSAFREFGDVTEEDYLIAYLQMAQRMQVKYVGGESSVSNDHVSVLRDLLLPLSPSEEFIEFAASLVTDLGMGCDRMPALVEGLLSAQLGSLLTLEMNSLRDLMSHPDFQQVWSLVRGFIFDVVSDFPFPWFDIISPALDSLTNLEHLEGTGPMTRREVIALGALLESKQKLLLSWTDFTTYYSDSIDINLASVQELIWILNPFPADLSNHNFIFQCTEAWDATATTILMGVFDKLNMAYGMLRVVYGMLSEENETCLAEALESSGPTLMTLFRNLLEMERRFHYSKSTFIIAPHCCLYLGIHDIPDTRFNCPIYIYSDGRDTDELCKLERLSLVVDGASQLYLGSFEKIVSRSKIKFLRTPEIETWDHILQSNIEVLELDHELSRESGEALCEVVANPNLKLRKLKLYSQLKPAVLERKLLAALESNYHSPLVELDIPWSTKAFKVKATQLLSRNPHVSKLLVRPTTAKLFMCGHGRVGKTTMAKNLTRSWSTKYYPALLQRHASTSGIDLQALEFDNGQALLVCDLAGQQEFHAFHHYFVRGSEKNLFLLVCKVVRGNLQELKDQLTYWLRFIVSHRSLAAGPTKVLVALNYFSKKKHMDYDPILTATNICKKYEALGVKHHIFAVVATRVKEVQQLTSILRACLVDILGTLHEIPGACIRAKRACQSLMQHGTCKILHINDVAEELLGSVDVEIDTVKAVLGILHDSGDVIYFGTKDGIISQYTVIHVQWFLRDVISHFLRPATTGVPAPNEAGYAEKERITHKLKLKCKETSSNDHPQYIFEALHEMGVLLPIQHGQKEKVVMPALLTQAYASTIPSENKCWGRRFSCKDKEFTLLPAAIFAKLQVKLQILCNNPSFGLGNGWASFEDDCIHIVVRVGGDTNSWEDRQWVDVMIRGPSKGRRVEEKAEEWLKKVRDCITEICMEACPSLELEENVLRLSYVKQRLTGGEPQQQQGPYTIEWEKLVCSVDKIKVQAREKGLDYLHTWESGFQDELTDLLFPLEQQHQLRKKAEEINGLSRSYQEIVSTTYPGAPSLLAEPQKLQSFPDHPEFGQLAQHIDNRLDSMEEHIYRIGEHIYRIGKTVEEVKENMNILIMDGKKIMAKCSRMLQNIEVECPRFPHLTDESNSFQRYCKVVGKTVRVHYLCESHSGNHRVQGSKGVHLVVAPEWLQASARALKPALILLFMGAKVGGALAGAAELTNAVVDEVKAKLKDFLDSCIQDCHLVEAPSAEDVELIFKRVVAEVGGGDKKRIMQHYFALHPGSLDNRTVWVCQDHL